MTRVNKSPKPKISERDLYKLWEKKLYEISLDPLELLKAAWYGDDKKVGFLLKLGADINRYGGTALLLAANLNDSIPSFSTYTQSERYLQTVKLLLEYGADVNYADANGETALLVASRRGHFDIVQLLLEYGADVNHADINGETPLMQASRATEIFRNYFDIVKLLLDYGADVNYVNNKGQTAIETSGMFCHWIVTLLRAERYRKVTTEFKNELTDAAEMMNERIKYRPGGVGYYEAKTHFETCVKTDICGV